jgi:hypothetical protein
LGNEIYYCIQCRIRVRWSTLGEGADRSRCGPCQGIEVRKDFLPLGQASTRIRRVSSSSTLLARPVAAKPRGTDRRPRKTALVTVLGAPALLTAAVAAIGAFSKISAPAPVEAPPAVLPAALAPVDLSAEALAKAAASAARTPAAPAPQSPPAPAVDPPPDPLRAEFLRQLNGLKDQAATAFDPERADQLLDLFGDALQAASRLAPERRGDILEWRKQFLLRYEAMADALCDSLEEAATALEGEGRTADALARLRTFPRGLRRSRAWTRLEALERQLQGTK